MSDDPGRAKGDPGGELFITPAGRTTVWTDGLLATTDRLAALETAVRDDLGRVRAADACLDGWPVPPEVPDRLRRVAELCADARDAFGRAAENYTFAEGVVERIQRDLGAYLAATLGAAALRMLAAHVLLAPGLVALAALVGWAAIPDTGDGKLETVKRFFMDNPELITDPGFVRWVSHLSTSIDDTVLGVLGLPGWLSLVPRPGSDAAVGAATVALLGAGVGMFRETPVAVERVSTRSGGDAPTGVRERLDRIPEGDQVRIERYEVDGMPPRYVVYIGPTETFSPFADREPWDSTSNVYGVAGLSPGSLRAVEAAMTDAGIRAGDEVVVTGFSQGGLLATMVAASDDWNVLGVETHGAPAGNVPVPDGTAGLAIRHTDDLVPALAGPQLDTTLVQVERRAFDAGAEIPGIQAAPAHQRTAYERTADAIDAAESLAIREQVATLDAFASDYLDRGGSVTEFRYRATREG